MGEEENGKWVYYGELELEKAKRQRVPSEKITFPEKKKGIVGRLADRRREAKQRRREDKEHKKQMKQLYREAARKEEKEAVKIQAGRDVRARVLKPKTRGATLRKIGRGLVDMDRALAGKPKKKRAKKGGSKIILIQDGKVKTLNTASAVIEDEPEQLDALGILLGSNQKKKRKKQEDVDSWKLLFG